MDFITRSEVNYGSGQLTVDYPTGALEDAEALRQIVAAVRSSNHDLELTDKQREQINDDLDFFERHRALILMLSSGAVIGLGFVLMAFQTHIIGFTRLSNALFALAAVLGLVAMGPSVITAAKLRKIDMNILMCIAVVGALFMGAYIEAAVVIFLDQVGEYLEGYSMRKTRGSIRKLMTLAPEEAHVILGTGTAEKTVATPVGEVAVGTRIQVRPGERIPLDGTIVRGASAIDESPVTGESVPVDKTVGAEVFAGSLNTNAVLEVVTTADEGGSMLARIVAMVEGAQAKRAPYEDFIDRFAGKYTPIVVVVAALIACVPPLITTFTAYDLGTWSRWVYTALTILVISCPCALVISTPVSFVSGITKAAKIGVLVKGGAFMEIASKVDAVAFDKTGTLTKGTPHVVAVCPAPGVEPRQVLEAAAALEAQSNHPLAQAVNAYAHAEKVVAPAVREMQEVAGNGVRGFIGEREVRVGKPAFIEEAVGAALPVEVRCELDVQLSRGATGLVVAEDARVLGFVAVADTLRPEARDAIERTGALGVGTMEMLTGDNVHAAQAIADELRLTSVRAELLPEDKIARIEELQASGHRVAMVGDGINDAPALAAANIGVTMGAASSDTALEVADVALMSGDLRQLPAFLHLARRTMVVVRQNITVAIAVKVLFLVLAFFGKTSMWMAVFADTGITLIVILNGMRLMLGGTKA